MGAILWVVNMIKVSVLSINAADGGRGRDGRMGLHASSHARHRADELKFPLSAEEKASG